MSHVASDQTRIDSASRLIRAPRARVYAAFADPRSMESWLPPAGMTGRMLAFDFREGGSYRMRLTYEDPHGSTGKTSDDSDEAEVRLVRLIEDEAITQAVRFDSPDPAFSGEMTIRWTLEGVADGTRVTVRCENVPAGIRAEDHESALNSTLANLAAFVEADGS